MKVTIIAHTPIGVFKGEERPATEGEVTGVEDLLKKIAEAGDYFTLVTAKGKVILSKGVIQQTVFEIVKK